MSQCRFLLEGTGRCSSPSAQKKTSICTHIPPNPELSSALKASFKSYFLQEALEFFSPFSFFHTPSSTFLALGRAPFTVGHFFN